MKHFVVFLVVFIIACCMLPNFEFSQKTRRGEVQENFQPLTSRELPYVLSTYLSTNFVKFEVASIPNHVKDLFRYNKDFSIVYRTKPKYTFILVEPMDSVSNNQHAFKAMQDKLRSELKYYQNDYNIIYRQSNTPIDYSDPYDKKAVKSLLEQCRNFCMIDPNKDIIFVMKRLSNTEADAIPVLLQEYHELLK